MKEKRDLESELVKLQNEIAKGAQMRSKERWINEGEKIQAISQDQKRKIKLTIPLKN